MAHDDDDFHFHNAIHISWCFEIFLKCQDCLNLFLKATMYCFIYSYCFLLLYDNCLKSLLGSPWLEWHSARVIIHHDDDVYKGKMVRKQVSYPTPSLLTSPIIGEGLILHCSIVGFAMGLPLWHCNNSIWALDWSLLILKTSIGNMTSSGIISAVCMCCAELWLVCILTSLSAVCVLWGIMACLHL